MGMRRIWTTLGLLVWLTGCGVLRLREEAQTFYATTILVGRIDAATAGHAPVIVAAWRMQGNQPEIVHATRLHEAGGYELIVPMGRYRLFAFADANGNARYDSGEAAAQYQGPPGEEVEVSAATGGVVLGLDMALSSAPLPRVLAGAQILPASALSHSTQVGALFQLDDARFGPQAGQKAYWSPVDFYREMGGNIYFLEPYDPNRIPILFVHGAQGSPRDWQAVVAGLDRRRYQAWFYFYPSGVAVESMSFLLYWKLLNVQLRYGFPRLYITAHSMGGLVTRSFLENFGAQFPQIRLFVSVATPWGGDAAAENGVRYSPAVVPSWEDMRPEGRFIHSLFQKPQPAQLSYALFFAHRGSPGLWRPNNDGTVTLASQLRPEAQAAASQVFGVDEGHVGVLHSEAFLQRYQALLASLDQRLPSGRLGVSVQFQAGMESRPIALLRLQPVQPAGLPVLTPIEPAHDIAQLPPGRYRASVFAYGFRAAPDEVELQIGADERSQVAFSLSPQRALAGYAVAPVRAGAQPAGQLRRMAEDLEIEEIRLEGPSGRRRLVPVRGGAEAAIERYLAGQDYAFDAAFSFVDLQPGTHTLLVRAAGRKPYRATVEIAPERTMPALQIELPPD